MPSKKIIIIIMIVVLSFTYYSCNRPEVSKIDNSRINTLKDPQQSEIINKERFIKKFGDTKLIIKPQAKYKISARVVGVKSYFWSWDAKLAPKDFALAWGELSKNKNLKSIDFSQRNRWYYYQWDKDNKLSKKYIAHHSSNNHIIPATDNLYRAIKLIDEGDKIEMKGFLVNIKGLDKGKSVWWNTSLSRQDTGDGSCEVLYIKELKLGNKVYK